MSHRAVQGVRRSLRKPCLFDPGQKGEFLPEAYRKFWYEWTSLKREPVHYIPEPGNWKRNPLTGEVKPVQNIPIPLKFPKESYDQMWGGEGLIQGFQKRNPYKRRVAHFWFPQLKQSVVYSEILNKHMSVVVTERTIELIHKHKGFDHYILKTPACDLQSILAIRMKRHLLHTLDQGTLYPDDPEKREEVLNKYKDYLIPYTKEDLEWYGLKLNEAIRKVTQQENEKKQEMIQPLKHQYRMELVERLLEIKAKGDPLPETEEELELGVETKTSWLKKLNPFSGKSQETSTKS